MQDSKAQVNHDTIVDDWRQNAERHDDENYEFLRSMKFRDYGFDPDDLAGQLHNEAFQIVDCTRCANCCKTMEIKLDDEDVERIAGHLDMEIDDFIQTYLEPDDEDDPYKIRGKPCPFLSDDDRCKIYDVQQNLANYSQKFAVTVTELWNETRSCGSRVIAQAAADNGGRKRGVGKRNWSWFLL